MRLDELCVSIFYSNVIFNFFKDCFYRISCQIILGLLKETKQIYSTSSHTSRPMATHLLVVEEDRGQEGREEDEHACDDGGPRPTLVNVYVFSLIGLGCSHAFSINYTAMPLALCSDIFFCIFAPGRDRSTAGSWSSCVILLPAVWRPRSLVLRGQFLV
jgi:hypothetical protein